jgi:hypothetical protein
MKKSWSSFWPSKILKLPNEHELKFLFLSNNYHPLCKLTVLNGGEKDRFNHVYKFIYFKLFYWHVTIFIFFQNNNPWPNEAAAGFNHEYAVIRWLWNERYDLPLSIRLCWWSSCMLYSKPPTPGSRVTTCLCSKAAPSFGQESLFWKKIKLITC